MSEINLKILNTSREMAQAAAQCAAKILIEAIARKGEATFAAATGASQMEFLESLTSIPGIEWSKTILFHLDEYVGIPDTHPASFRRYLNERLVMRAHPGMAYWIHGDNANIDQEIKSLNNLLSCREVDVAFVGIGENGHLAFNDPPADFETEDPYLLVHLDETCRRQQWSEGWYQNLEDVPAQAISMSIRQILKSKAIICTVPDQRKAQAVYDCLNGEISPVHPASVVRMHPNAYIFLDSAAASLLGIQI
jgi:glucosamine-6-phosphate deaminase